MQVALHSAAAGTEPERQAPEYHFHHFCGSSRGSLRL